MTEHVPLTKPISPEAPPTSSDPAHFVRPTHSICCLRDHAVYFFPASIHNFPVGIKSKTMSRLVNIQTVGGEKGSEFAFDGTACTGTLKKLEVWEGDVKIKAMKVGLSNGQSMLFGDPAGVVKEFTFEDGENFASLSLWANADGTRLGAIRFKTNRSREFYARCSKSLAKECPIDVGSGTCVGVRGRSGSDIDRLGFMFFQTDAHY